jgi:hypothetical protein
MKYDAAFEALKRANPEPDPAALVRDLSRRPEPTTIVVRDRPRATPVTKPKSFHWRPLLAGGTAAVALVTLMLVPWVDGRNVVDSLWPSPVDVAVRYMEARNTFDASAAEALIADDAQLFDQPRMELSELELAFEYLRIYEIQLEPFECENRAGSTLVTCAYQMDTRLSRIVGHPPVAGRIQFLAENGLITYLVHDFNYSDYAPDVFEPYIDWLNEEHPGIKDQLFIEVDGVHTPILTRESLDLAGRYLDEYDRFLNG